MRGLRAALSAGRGHDVFLLGRANAATAQPWTPRPPPTPLRAPAKRWGIRPRSHRRRDPRGEGRDAPSRLFMHPGDCSPSRRVVSKIEMRRSMLGFPRNKKAPRSPSGLVTVCAARALGHHRPRGPQNEIEAQKEEAEKGPSKAQRKATQRRGGVDGQRKREGLVASHRRRLWCRLRKPVKHRFSSGEEIV